MANVNDNQSFRVDPNVYLGHKYNSYKDKLFAFSVAQPSNYLKLREQITTALKTDLIDVVYKLVFNALTQGTIVTNGNTQFLVSGNGLDGSLAPNFPPQKVGEIALSASATFDKLMDEVVELIIPISFNKVVEKSLDLGARASIVNN